MFEDINKHREAVQEQIQKGFEIGFTGGELEKAHNVGDIHPNGKWVWTQLASGKYDWRVIKKQDKTTSSGEKQSDKLPELKFSEKDFKKVENDEESSGVLPLHDYEYKAVVDYYDNDGNKRQAGPFITEFYANKRGDKIGGYAIYFGKADAIGTFATLKEAIAGLNSWVNKMRVKGHAKPTWIYNQSKGDYQMNYKL